MKVSFWTIQRQRDLEKSAAAGHTAKAVAERWGITRSAVLGRAFRTNVHFKRERRHKKRRMAGHPPEVRVRALAVWIAAQTLGTLGRRQAIESLGVSYESVVQNWQYDTELMAEAKALANAAVADICNRREAAARQEQEMNEWRESLRRDHNALVLPLLKSRDCNIIAALEGGESTADVAVACGVSRQRIHQIVCRAAGRGYDWGSRYKIDPDRYRPSGRGPGRPRKAEAA